ncbi:hypothetical protein [Paucibacter sp. DJ2R-2]|uniref:hypothetical protein n=1 Tax=Paucibacter sp. DJ2R-2 TaxID=2893558 RepID=UPI0021E4C101|nr:hypothetical protein [Paucibacter sp. DJ2R-2]MCV2438656.1 hypothetical protein [Paucibacter sp. DJ2R-2]
MNTNLGIMVDLRTRTFNVLFIHVFEMCFNDHLEAMMVRSSELAHFARAFEALH